MKIKTAIIASAIIFTNLSFAQSTEDFFYQRGYEQGYNSGFEAGVAAAFQEAKNMIGKYDQSLKAFEAGKYLVQSKRLTAPQLWQEVDNSGRVIFRVKPSEIQKEIDVEELFQKFATIPTIKAPDGSNLELSLAEKNSVNLSERDNNTNAITQKSNATANKVILPITKSARNLDILKKANVVFSEEDNSYNVLFFTATEKENFCKQFEICN